MIIGARDFPPHFVARECWTPQMRLADAFQEQLVALPWGIALTVYFEGQRYSVVKESVYFEGQRYIATPCKE